jgi:deoxyribodipyrimidine photo-lyase
LTVTTALALALFEPTAQAAKAKLLNIQPQLYAKSRNALDGAVTRLSPYITHGILTIPEAVAHLMGKYRLGFDDKLIFEFAWREFFHHAWQHLGNKIFADVKAPCWPGDYAQAMPTDVLTGTTGVPAIDAAVAELYRTGYLHNHARMWLASYIVHLRKVHWRVGADWMVAYLLDGDLASNHLSWQWVASTFSAKPYLFNAGNVEKYAPVSWHSNGTAIDSDYDTLEDIARHKADVGPQPDRQRSFAQAQTLPPVFSQPPPQYLKDWQQMTVSDLPKKDVLHLVHPWNLSEYLVRAGGRKQRLGIVHLPFHALHPWSEKRWEFVLTRMKTLTDWVFVGDATTLIKGISSAHSVLTYNPHYYDFLMALQQSSDFQLEPEPTQFLAPTEFCASFTRYYQQVKAQGGKFGAVVDNRY